MCVSCLNDRPDRYDLMLRSGESCYVSELALEHSSVS